MVYKARKHNTSVMYAVAEGMTRNTRYEWRRLQEQLKWRHAIVVHVAMAETTLQDVERSNKKRYK